jgi:hypothetical protein
MRLGMDGNFGAGVEATMALDDAFKMLEGIGQVTDPLVRCAEILESVLTDPDPAGILQLIPVLPTLIYDIRQAACAGGLAESATDHLTDALAARDHAQSAQMRRTAAILRLAAAAMVPQEEVRAQADMLDLQADGLEVRTTLKQF